MAALAIAIGSSLYSPAAQSPTAAKDAPKVGVDDPWPDGPGKAVVKKACLSCHGVNVIVAPPGRTGDQWANVVSTMVGRGAILSDEDSDTLQDYLTANFGPNSKSAPSAPEKAPAQPPSSDEAPPPPAAGAATAASPSASSAPLNVNKASADDLQAALGLTKAEAELMVQHREQNGDYKNWHEVASVPGVPAQKIEENQKRLTF